MSKESIKLSWRCHDKENVRVWRNDWFPDQFEVITNDEFYILQKFCRIFSIDLVEAED